MFLVVSLRLSALITILYQLGDFRYVVHDLMAKGKDGDKASADLLNVVEDLESVRDAGRVSLSNLVSDVTRIKRRLAKVEAERDLIVTNMKAELGIADPGSDNGGSDNDDDDDDNEAGEAAGTSAAGEGPGAAVAAAANGADGADGDDGADDGGAESDGSGGDLSERTGPASSGSKLRELQRRLAEDPFFTFIDAFLERAKDKVETLEADVDEVATLFGDVAER